MTATETTIGINGMAYVILTVSQFAAARAFYGRLLYEVRDACKTPLLPGLGCAHLNDGWCIITLPRTPVLKSAGYTANVVIRHEMAHCNGWPREHPNARNMWVR